MTDDPSHFHDADADADGAALDRLLAAAEWPTPDANAVRRLTRTVADERRRRLRIRWPLPAAVAAAVAVGGVCWIAWPGSRSATPGLSPVAVRPPVERPQAAPSKQSNLSPRTPAPAGRPATAMERMLVMTAVRNPPPKSPAAGDAASAAAARRSTGAGDRAGVVLAARAVLARPSRSATDVDERRVAARLVALATPADWPLVRAFAERPQTRTATLAALVAHRDDESVDLLLRGLLDPSLRPAVLIALKNAPSPPTSALLDKFDASRMDERWAAAVALGRKADAATLARLAAMAERGEHRRESIAALIASDTPASRAWLDRLSNTRDAAPHVAPAREAIAVLLVRENVHPCFLACGS